MFRISFDLEMVAHVRSCHGVLCVTGAKLIVVLFSRRYVEHKDIKMMC